MGGNRTHGRLQGGQAPPSSAAYPARPRRSTQQGQAWRYAWPLLLPPLVDVLPGNQSQRSPRCSQKRLSSNNNRPLWKFTSVVDAAASRHLRFRSCFRARSLCPAGRAWGRQLRAWGAAGRLRQLPVAAAAAVRREQPLLFFRGPAPARGLAGPAPARPGPPGSSRAPAAVAPFPFSASSACAFRAFSRCSSPAGRPAELLEAVARGLACGGRGGGMLLHPASPGAHVLGF